MIYMIDPLVLFSFGEMFSDMGFIIKLFLLVAILGFLNQHIENKILKVVVALFMGYIMLIVNWSTFGTLYVIYAVLGMGISSMFVDYFFMTQGSGHADQAKAGVKLKMTKNQMAGLPPEYGLSPNDMEHMGGILEEQNNPKKKGLFGRLFGGGN